MVCNHQADGLNHSFSGRFPMNRKTDNYNQRITEIGARRIRIEAAETAESVGVSRPVPNRTLEAVRR